MKIKNIPILLFIFLIASCSILNRLGEFSKLRFKISNADNIKLGDIDISNKKNFEDLSVDDIRKLYRIVYDEKIPLSFDLYVTASNPNKGRDNLPPADIVLKSFPFKIYIDEKETISGNIKEPVVISASDVQKDFLITISVDMWEFYKGNNFNNSVEPILKFGGTEGITSHIKLKAKPVIETPVGDYSYPEEITIVDYQFN